ncbi:helix-turn-helix domain-containing protein [Bradyrhizobium sp. UNPA324]|uniref:helix-turn-helix transcriptional regulator n=1 Tax=Bradyrhizobium sp. UNPA324 TaxID=1141174 RepID=UPI0011520435|nr:helix-turn-helix domain-containing protein [Bradyrhizobium sp. UNPA324]
MSTIQANVTGRRAGPDTVVKSVDPDELVDPTEAARLVRQKPDTLAHWRCDGRGPEYLKIGRSIFYRRSAISAWLATQIVRPQAEVR